MRRGGEGRSLGTGQLLPPPPTSILRRHLVWAWSWEILGFFCPEMGSIPVAGERKGLPTSKRSLCSLGRWVGEAMRRGLWASPAAPHLHLEWRAAAGSGHSGVPPAGPLRVPGGASTAPGLSALSPGCPAAMSSLFRAHTLFLLTAWALAEEPQSLSRPGPPLPWASVTKLGEPNDLMVDGKIITTHLLQAPRPSLPLSNTWTLQGHLPPAHLSPGRPGEMGTWQQEIVLRSSNCSFKLICETASGGAGIYIS